MGDAAVDHLDSAQSGNMAFGNMTTMTDSNLRSCMTPFNQL